MFSKILVKKKNVSDTSLWLSFVPPLVALTATLIISSILLIILDYQPLTTFYAFFIEPLTSLYSFVEIIMKATILIIIALGLTIGFRANVWNIGAEGQFIFGAISGSLVALYFYEKDGFYIIPLMIFAGIIGGMFWAIIPALLKNRFNTNEILSSLMLVYVAQLFLSYLVHGPLKDPQGMNFPQSIYFSDSAIYPYIIEGTRFSITPLMLVIIFPFIYLALTKSYLGFQLKVSGYSPLAANYGGFCSKKMVWISFLTCGALAGLSGISEVSANIGQLIPKISPGYGFTAIIVAFLGRLNPIGIIFSGLLMALVYIGAESSQIMLGLPVSIGGVFQGLILFCLLAADFFLFYKIEFKRK